MARASVAVISTRHVLSHRARRHSDPELDEELMSDSLFAPADVRDRYLDDQLLELFWYRRTSFASRFPPPKQTKSFPVPSDERVRLHDDEGILPVEQPSSAAIVNLVAFSVRRGVCSRSTKNVSCFRRKRFSAARAPCERTRFRANAMASRTTGTIFESSRKSEPFHVQN